jgi:hypothetical protein
MENYKVLIIVLGVCYFVFRFLKRKKRTSSLDLDQLTGTLASKRQQAGKWTDSRAEVTAVAQTGDLESIQSVIDQAGSVEERDELFKIAIGQTYYHRSDDKLADVCESIGLAYVDYFSENFKFLSRKKGYSLHNLGFKYLAIVLTEREKFEQAASVCQKAISFNLTDNTKTGYEGRLQRINKGRGRFQAS